MSAVDVAVEHVWKEYRRGTGRGGEGFWALRDVTLEVPRGASLGIIGRNGAGKSTLLKMLAGISAPSRGRIVIDGRLAALIEVGSGFHPELTGRENVFLSGAILGMRRREIAQKIERIVEFAGVQAFIDTPVKWYSSGMYVRLGFAIAAHLEPDILLVDEVLAVGDAEFQAKCISRIQELQRRDVTIVFISHDLTAVERLCDSAVLFDGGQIVSTGPPANVVALYHRRITAAETQSDVYTSTARDGVLTVTNLVTHDPLRPGSLTARTGDPLVTSARYSVSRPLEPLVFQLSYYSADGRTLIARTETDAPVDVRPPGGIIEFTCPELPLVPGAYCLTLVVRSRATREPLAWWDGSTMLHVEPGAPVDGQFHVPHAWRVRPAEVNEDGGGNALYAPRAPLAPSASPAALPPATDSTPPSGTRNR